MGKLRSYIMETDRHEIPYTLLNDSNGYKMSAIVKTNKQNGAGRGEI